MLGGKIVNNVPGVTSESCVILDVYVNLDDFIIGAYIIKLVTVR